MNILLAEDNDNDIFLLKTALRDCVNISLNIAKDGEEVIRYLQGEAEFSDREKFPLPTLLLLDIKMPRKNGFEVMDWIRSSPVFSALPIVVLTSSQLKDDIEKAYNFHANSYLSKSSFTRCPEGIREIIAYWQNCSKSPNLGVDLVSEP